MATVRAPARPLNAGWFRVSSLVQLECCYQNRSDRMVILRCVGPNCFFLERVVFPTELLAFEAPGEADVEIWCHSLGGPDLIERFSADDLSSTPNRQCEPQQQSWPQSA
jgi:hypothetical protein